MKKIFIVLFLFAIGFNVFHDYVIIVAEESISKSSYTYEKETEIPNSLENVHETLHMHYIENQNKTFSFKEFSISQKPILKYQINLKILKKEIFKPPITA